MTEIEKPLKKYCPHCGTKLQWKTDAVEKQFDANTGQPISNIYEIQVCPAWEKLSLFKKWWVSMNETHDHLWNWRRRTVKGRMK